MDGQTITIDESVVVIFIPKGDDTFACDSHLCLAVVRTPQGDYLFSKPVNEPQGNDFA